ncbi:hypothetical protein [Spirosoma litoris]
MGVLKHIDSSQETQESARGTSNLSLYDRYGSLAYGIILKIIPEPELAQKVLIDLFASLHIKSYTENGHRISIEIIRLARIKALEASPPRSNKFPFVQDTMVNDDLEKLVFDLSFYKGYSTEEIANKLQLSQTNVLSMVYAYFKQQRSS